MRIQGLKNAPMGTHNIVRYVTYNGEKKIVSTYKMERSGNEIKLFHEEVDITETVRSIEFKKSGVLLMAPLRQIIPWEFIMLGVDLLKIYIIDTNL